MATKSIELQPISRSGWNTGFTNMFAKECAAWRKPKRWLVLLAATIAITNGFLEFLLLSSSKMVVQQGPEAVERYIVAYFIMVSGLVTALGATLVTQDSILDERRSGTAAWVLSKPVSRVSFILSKLAAHTLGFLVIGVVIPGLIAFTRCLLGFGLAPRADLFGIGLAIIVVHLLFYMTLTMMLSTLIDVRAVVVGIPLAFLFGQLFLISGEVSAAALLPGALISGGPHRNPLIFSIVLGQYNPDILPLVATIVWIMIFVGISLWRFQREEF